MTSFVTFTGSSVGKKVLVAITGLLLFGFVTVHLLGNLTLLIPDQGQSFNEYAYKLENLLNGWLVKIFSIGLATIFLVHGIFAVTAAWWDKRRARPQRYAKVKNAGGKSRKSLASISMIVTGPLILAFVIWHVSKFKFTDHPMVTYDGVVMKDFYTLVVAAFQNPLITVTYMVVMVLLGMHLWHGAWSAFQSLGWNSDRHIKCLTRLSIVAAVVLGVGFIALPPYIYFFAATGGQ